MKYYLNRRSALAGMIGINVKSIHINLKASAFMVVILQVKR